MNTYPSKTHMQPLKENITGLLSWLRDEESTASAADMGSIPSPGRSHVLRSG